MCDKRLPWEWSVHQARIHVSNALILVLQHIYILLSAHLLLRRCLSLCSSRILLV